MSQIFNFTEDLVHLFAMISRKATTCSFITLIYKLPVVPQDLCLTLVNLLLLIQLATDLVCPGHLTLFKLGSLPQTSSKQQLVFLVDCPCLSKHISSLFPAQYHCAPLPALSSV